MSSRRLLICCILAVPFAVSACKKGSATPTQRPGADPHPADAAESRSDSATITRDSTTDAAAIKRTVAAVTTDINHLTAASAVEQQHLLPAHEQLVRGMLTRFETKVRAMHVTVDPDWVAVIDSVKTDLARMPRMSPAELHAYIPGHAERVMRIVVCIDMVRM